MDSMDEFLCERLELAIGRLDEIPSEKFDASRSNEKDYFDKVSEFLLLCYDVYVTKNAATERTDLSGINKKLYEDILPCNYEKSYANPDYAAEKLSDYGQILSALYAELRSGIAYVYEDRLLEFVSLLELFIEVYCIFYSSGKEKIDVKAIKDVYYYYMYDYADVLVSDRTLGTFTANSKLALDIIMDSDLNDITYLYRYGEYIGDNEIKTAKYLNSLDEEKVIKMAETYVNGFVDGFINARIDLKAKKTVNIRYSIGQERMVRYAIELFKKQGLSPVIFRYAVSRCNRKLTTRVGFVGTPANKQYEYDHRMDEAIFYDKAYVERKLSVISDTYEKNKEPALEYAGPAVIEVFGEAPFNPVVRENAIKLNEKQQGLSVFYASKAAEITNKYIPRDKYSFTIIAYPIPEIGDDFEQIYDEIVKVNTLDKEEYKRVQQTIIDELDMADYIQVVGDGENKTDMKVMLHDIDRDRETNFENCLADVNIPVGEVFTSPVLKGTEGILNVSSVYLNELEYKDLTICFKDGMISGYSCSNYETEEKNKAFIKENLMFNHDTLPIGEFAIGTNTTAYVMAHRFDILYKLPILIVEKMGPHFAVGDTCYSYSEENILYNPDGKEIVAKDNECSILRKSGDAEALAGAYFNCHTDITIPYEEIGGIYSVHGDGKKVAIIENGRFVLSGTEMLNAPFESWEG